MNRREVRTHLAAECAGDQNAYWRFATHSYQNPAVARRRNGWMAVAESISVADIAEFAGCVESRYHLQSIKADNDQARQLGILGTPTSFVNGARVTGAATFESMDSLVAYYLDRL